MQYSNRVASVDGLDNLCPDLTTHWLLDDKIDSINRVILRAKEGKHYYQFGAIEGYALKYFTGQYTARQVLNRCRSRFGTFIPSDFIPLLLQELVDLEILPPPTAEVPETPTLGSPGIKATNFIRLKSSVQWIPHPDGYWILRNPEDVTCLQIDNCDKEVIVQLGEQPLTAIVNQHDISLDDLQYLLRILAAAGMLEETKLQKPANQLSLKQLLYSKNSVINLDTWLTQSIDKVPWIWTWQFGYALCVFITASFSILLAFSAKLLASSKQVWVNGNLVTLTGINHVQKRFQSHTQWLPGEDRLEKLGDGWILATYAPLRLVYTIVVLGYFLSLAWNWLLLNAPIAIDLTKLPIFH